MGWSRFLALLLISALLFSLHLPRGSGRMIKVMKHYGRPSYSSQAAPQEKVWIGREMVEMEMDYKEPGANVNPRGGGGYFNSPPSPPRP